MKSRKLMCIAAMTLLTLLAIPARLAAQRNQGHKQEHHHYKLIDVGTFGGPNTNVNPGTVVINKQGAVVGSADTTIPDPYAPNCFNSDCFVSHAFQWEDGIVSDLGALPGGYSSLALAINSPGQIVGVSQNGLIDSTTGIPAFVATVWDKGQIGDLGTFGGSFSLAIANNNFRQVVGFAENNVPDPFNFGSILFVPSPTEYRAFVWQDGQLEDLGTLGVGTEAFAIFINDEGQVVGASLTDSIVNPVTGFPTLHPFLWDKRQNPPLVDLGTLGGAFATPTMINNLGEVAGSSNLPGDLTAAPFLWTAATGMQNLGTFGGSCVGTNWLNDHGDVVGFECTQGDQTFHAFLWSKGLLTDLGTLAGGSSSAANSINSKGQVVGVSDFPHGNSHAFLWENGGPMIDLNTLIPPDSALELFIGASINDRGEITGQGLLANGDEHVFVLIPCDESHADEKDCENAGTSTASQNIAAPVTQNPTTITQGSPSPSDRMAAIRARLAHRHPYHGFGTYQPK
jgi:probable HAF family extracellular repeat protein